MLIGVPKEIKNHEYRVGLVPSSVRELMHHGHKVLVETKAGGGIGFSDAVTRRRARPSPRARKAVFAKDEMIVKVKEPQPKECKKRGGPAALHLSAPGARIPTDKALLKSGSTAVAYETVTSARGGLPLLAPMSEVAGRMSVQVGAHYLEKEPGGAGILLGGVPGVRAAHVTVIGGGVSGTQASPHGDGHGSAGHRDRPFARPAARGWMRSSAPSSHHLLDRACDRGIRAGIRSRDRCRAGAGCGGAEAGDAQDDQVDAARLGRGPTSPSTRAVASRPATRRPMPTGLCGRRRDALLRRQHARRGGAHLDLRAQQRDPALYYRAGQQGRAARLRPGPASDERAQHP